MDGLNSKSKLFEELKVGERGIDPTGPKQWPLLAETSVVRPTPVFINYSYSFFFFQKNKTTLIVVVVQAS